MILQTTDLHGRLDGATPDGGAGWRTVARLVSQERQKAGGACLLVDCGDTLAGSYSAWATEGRISSHFLQQLGYDAWIPGNHDFDFGLDAFLAAARQQEGRILCGNLEIEEELRPGETTTAWKGKAWRMFDRGGVRLAVIGASLDHVSNWTLFHGGTRRLRILPLEAWLPQAIGEIHRQHPDLIVLALHDGYRPDNGRQRPGIPAQIAASYPEIRLILGGHTHIAEPGRLLPPRGWLVQAAPLGAAVAKIAVAIDPGSRRCTRLESELLFDPDRSDDPAGHWLGTSDEAKEWQRRIAQRKTIVGRFRFPVSSTGIPGRDCPATELAWRAAQAVLGADGMLEAKTSNTTLAAGPVSDGDLFFLFPYENPLLLAELSAAELETILAEQCRSPSEAAGGLHGLRWQCRNGQAKILEPKPRRFKIVVNAYLAAGAGGRFPELARILNLPETKTRPTGIRTRDLVRTYLQQHPETAVQPQAWRQ